MDQALTNLGLTPDPNNPYYTPPGAAELGLRALGTALTPIAAQRSNTAGGALLRGGAGLVGGLAGETGQAMAAKRLDPTTQAILAQRGAAQAMNQIQVGGQPSGSLAPFTPAPTDLSGAMFTSVPSALPAFPAIAPSVPRRPESLPEALRNATPEQQAKLMAGVTIGKMQLPDLFEAPYYSHSKYPLIKISGDQVREVNNPSLTADETLSDQAQNLHAKIALMRAKEPNNPLWKDIERSYMLSGTTNAEQRYALEIALNGGDALKALKDLNDVKATAAGQRSEQSQLGTIRAQGTPQAAAAQENLAAGRERGQLRIMSSPEYLQNQAEITARKETAQRLNARMSPEQERRYNGYVGLKTNLDTIGETYRPEWVGGLPAALGFQGELDKATSEAMAQANQGKYSGGSLIGRMKAYWGNLPPEQARLYRALADSRDRILRARSGAQVSVPEAERLLEIVPKANDMPSVFEAKFNDFALDVVNEQKSILDAVIQSPQNLRQGLGNGAPALRRGTVPPPPPIKQSGSAASPPVVNYDDRWKEIQAELARRRKQ